MNMSKRITITLSDFAFRKLACWAALHERPKTSYASQIIEARVEANIDVIEKLMTDEAKNQGITIEELEAKYLKSEE
jgi:hypothetical protein